MTAELRVDSEGDVAVLTIANPAKRNALDPALCAALAAALGQLKGAEVRAAVLTGAPEGRAFSAGFDLDALPDPAAAPTAAEDVFTALLDAVAACPVPLVAALGGAAIGGGCELAAACDLRVAHAGVKLGLPPARLGIVYAPRGLARLSAICGESRARQLFLLARTVDAAEAHAWGLVDFVVPEAEVLPRARALAAEMAALAPLAVQGMRLEFEALLARRIELAAPAAADLAARRAAAWASADAVEGRAAAAERRTPRFSGR